MTSPIRLRSFDSLPYWLEVIRKVRYSLDTETSLSYLIGFNNLCLCYKLGLWVEGGEGPEIIGCLQ